MLQAPGQVLGIAITSQGRDSVGLVWRAPVDGGEVAAYQIQRRENRGDWTDVATSVQLGHLLGHQPRGVELEFRIHAINRAGAGKRSFAVRVPLAFSAPPSIFAPSEYLTTSLPKEIVCGK